MTCTFVRTDGSTFKQNVTDPPPPIWYIEEIVRADIHTGVETKRMEWLRMTFYPTNTIFYAQKGCAINMLYLEQVL